MTCPSSVTDHMRSSHLHRAFIFIWTHMFYLWGAMQIYFYRCSPWKENYHTNRLKSPLKVGWSPLLWSKLLVEKWVDGTLYRTLRWKPLCSWVCGQKFHGSACSSLCKHDPVHIPSCVVQSDSVMQEKVRRISAYAHNDIVFVPIFNFYRAFRNAT